MTSGNIYNKQWADIDKVKYKILALTHEVTVIKDTIDSLDLTTAHNRKVNYKTLKFMKRDLHNKEAQLKTEYKLFRKLSK